MIVDKSLMIRAGFGEKTILKVGDALVEPCERFQINNPNRIATFLGQCAIESIDFTTMEELLSYSSVEAILGSFKRLKKYPANVLQTLVRNPQKLALYAYAGINGNGDIASGDGWTYRGSGWKQITGKGNFLEAENALNRPYVSQPDLIRKAPDSALTAAHFFASNGCNPLADAWKLDAITRVVNGPGMLKKVERAALSNKILAKIR